MLLTSIFASRTPPPFPTEFLSFQISQHRDSIFSIKLEHIELCFTNCHITSIKHHLWSKEKGSAILLLLHTSFALSQNQKRCRLVLPLSRFECKYHPCDLSLLQIGFGCQCFAASPPSKTPNLVGKFQIPNAFP